MDGYQHQPSTSKNGLGTESFDMSNCDTSLSASSAHSLSVSAGTSRKRKLSSFGTGSTIDEDDTDDPRCPRNVPDKKQNHSEIEKRRRDKMNTYISELSAMIPMCGAMARKLDKLTVLRMAVQHLRSIRGALSAGPLTARPRPSFLSERELNSLVLQAAHNTFLLVVGCDRGRLLYVSSSVNRMLQYEQSELLGQSLFDILHPKDIAKVKEQLSSSDLSPRERLIDAKTMLPVKADVIAGASRLCPGARRSFFCRIKCRTSENSPTPSVPAPTAPATAIKEEVDSAAKMRKKQNDRKYCVVQCTGYLKSWVPTDLEGRSASDVVEESEACSLSCLVAVGRALPDLVPDEQITTLSTPPSRCLQYVSRHTTDGKFIFVDQRVTLALGFLPQELLGSSMYEYISATELGAVARTHKAALLQRDAMHTPPYYFRRKDGSMARITTHFKPFRNPWTKDVECLVANNTVVADSFPPTQDDFEAFDIFKHNGVDVNVSPNADTNPDTDAATELIPDAITDAIGDDPDTDADINTSAILSGCDIDSALSEGDAEMQRLIDAQLESHKIGSAIAEEALRRSSPDFSTELPAEFLQDVLFSQQASLLDNILGVDESCYTQIRNNVALSDAGAENSPSDR